MNREDVRKLIGGYATGTLTEAEQRILFAAALEDQDLFDELAGEQAFKDLLEVPGARERLLTAVAPPPERRKQSWWAWGAIAAAAAAGLVLFIATRPGTTGPAVEIATVKQEPEKEAAYPIAQRAEPAVPAPTPQKEPPAKQAGQQEQQGAAAPAGYDRFGRFAQPAPPPPAMMPGPPAVAEDRQRATDQTTPKDSVVVNGGPAASTALRIEAADQPAPAPPPPAKSAPVAAVQVPAPVPQAAAKGGGGGGNRVAIENAQGDRGTITGAVSDPAGAVIPGAPIEVRNADTGALYTAASSATGNFSLPLLPAGNYEMTVALSGFKKFERQNITLQGAQVLRLDVPLEVGSAAESVTVAESATVTGVAGKAGKVSATKSALLQGKAKAATPLAFTYQRAAGSLRITPLAPGVLTVTAGSQSLFPQNAVLTGSNVIVPLPAGTGDVTIVFAASTGAPATPAVRRDGATGTVTEPNPTPNSRLAIIVPALP